MDIFGSLNPVIIINPSGGGIVSVTINFFIKEFKFFLTSSQQAFPLNLAFNAKAKVALIAEIPIIGKAFLANFFNFSFHIIYKKDYN